MGRLAERVGASLCNLPGRRSYASRSGLEQAELKEVECELPAACREAGRVSRELASEPGGRERQLVSEPELALFLSQGPELRDRAGLCSLPSLSICLHLRGKMILSRAGRPAVATAVRAGGTGLAWGGSPG